MKQIIGSLLSIAVLLSIAGCKNDCEPQTSVGSIIGFVNLIPWNDQAIDDFSGVKVSIDNTSIFAFTDSNGKFELKNVHAGTYDITVTKEGFGTYRQFSIPYAGGPAPGAIPYIDPGYSPTIILGKIPTYIISNFSMSTVNGKVTLNIQTPVPSALIRVYLNDGATVSSTEFKYAFSVDIENETYFNEFPILSSMSKKTFKVIAYPANRNYSAGTYYLDQATNRRIYTSLGTPTPISEVAFP